MSAAGYSTPSDRRIKKKIADIDEDALLQRLQSLEIKRYRYSDEWRRVRGIKDIEVRGVIAQQTRVTFPEYVNVVEKLSFRGTGFEMEQFHEVNKDNLAIDHRQGRGRD